MDRGIHNISPHSGGGERIETCSIPLPRPEQIQISPHSGGGSGLKPGGIAFGHSLQVLSPLTPVGGAD